MLLVASITLGCDDIASDEIATRYDTLGSGIPLVVNRLPESPSSAWSVQLVSSIGNLDGGGPEIFGRIADLEIDSSGNLYVLDELAQEVRVFDEDGNFLRALGRKGQGPGDLRGGSGLNLDHDGRLWVWDPGNVRFSIFVDTGYVEYRPRPIRAVIYPWRGEFASTGEMIDWGLDYPERVGNDPGSLAIFYPIRMLEHGGLDTLPPLIDEIPRGPGGPLPFASRLSIYQDERDKIWFSHQDPYRIFKRELTGDTLLAFSLEGSTPKPVTEADIDSVMRLYRRTPSGIEAPSRSDLPETRPIVRRIITNSAGMVLVFAQTSAWESGEIVDIFTESGVFQGRVELPVRLALDPPPVLNGTMLVGVTLGAMDVPSVVTIRLKRDGTRNRVGLPQGADKRVPRGGGAGER